MTRLTSEKLQVCFGVAIAVLFTATVFSQSVEPDRKETARESDFTISERGAHHRVWERIEYEARPDGQKIPHVRSYTELSTGMHFKDPATGQWRESKAEIEILPNGAGAKADQSQHKVIFPANIHGGLIEVLTPDGKWLRSQVLGLSYFDTSTGESVLIAEIKESAGELHGDNVVLYSDAFTDLRADIRYTHTLAAFEQDIILREMPPSPALFGLNPETTRIEVMTELFDPPAPGRKEIVFNERRDEDLDFGAMWIGPGRAFPLGDSTGEKSDERVLKSWERLEGRDFLIEQVEFRKIEDQLLKLPRMSAVEPQGGSRQSALARRATKGRALPEPKLAKHTTNTIQMARGNVDSSPGYVLDYVLLNSSVTNFTFKGDTTYYVSGLVTLRGTNIIEGGTVVKYANTNGARLYFPDFNGPVICKTGHYRPAVFTAKDDNSVGETISGSSGNPSGNYASIALDRAYGLPVVWQNLRISYASIGLQLNLSSDVINVQFINVGTPMNASYGTFRVENVLMCNVTNKCFVMNSATIRAQNMTAHNVNTLGTGIYSTVSLTNCLLISVTSCSITGDYTTFYGGSNATNNSDAGIFQVVGGGGHYLATNSPYRDVGTTNVTTNMLEILRRTTTYPPIVFSNATISVPTNFGVQALRDSDVPDLGYHYDPLDWAFGGCDVNTNITFTAGAAVGWFRTSSGWYHAGHGIHVGDRQTVTFDGTVDAPCWWVRANTVQEQGGNTIWQGGYGPGGITSWADQYGSITNAGQVNARFLKCSSLSGDSGNHFRDDWGILIGRFQDSEFYNSGIQGYNSSFYFTNCLFHRAGVGGMNEGRPGNALVVRNSTWYGGSIYLTPTYAVPAINVQDCALDGTSVTATGHAANSSYATYRYNAYTNATNPFPVGGSHDKQSVAFNWQSGALGGFYLPTNSVLINAGSTNSHLLGLYHFTTQTNQVKETNSMVDIGYHYVAVTEDGSGAALDTDGDGLPDYVEDTNGDGVHGEGDLSDWASLDTDGDGLSDYGELTKYGSNPKNPHTFNATKNDAEYLFTAYGSESPNLDATTMARLQYSALPDFHLGIRVLQAPANAVYDLYFVNNIGAQRWQWRRIYSGIQCDANGEAYIVIKQPDPNMGFFRILDAGDDDDDGLSNGYETWFRYGANNDLRTLVNNRDSDADGMRDGWEVAYGLDSTDSVGLSGRTGNPDGDAFTNIQEYNNNSTFNAPTYDPLKHFINESSRPVVWLSSSDSIADGAQGAASFTINRSSGSDALTVYYSVGGEADYGVDYTLNPSPSEYPRIFSAVIPSGQPSVTVTLSPIQSSLKKLGFRKVFVKLTPYSVSPTTQVADPLAWKYVVNVFKESVTLSIFDDLPGLNGPVYAVKVYKTAIYDGEACSEYHQLIVGGQFTQAGSVAATNIARFNFGSGTWEPLGTGVNGIVRAIEAIERFPGDNSPDIYAGGDFTLPARAIAKWNGASSTWSALGGGLDSEFYNSKSFCRVNVIRNIGGSLWVGGRFQRAGGIVRPNLAKWNLSNSQWETLGGTVINYNGAVTTFGLESQTIMVTAIDPNGNSVGVSRNGIECGGCPIVGMINGEAFYTVENGGATLRGQGRSVLESRMAAVLGNIAGHGQIPQSSPYLPAIFRYTGLSQLGDNGWQVFATGGSALPPPNGSPWWPASTYVSGWKAVGDVNAIVNYGQNIFFGGYFDTLTGSYPASPPPYTADHTPFNNVFVWNQVSANWTRLANASGISCVVPGALGVNGTIHAMDVDYSLCTGDFLGVWVGGSFSQAGGGSASNIAFYSFWNGNPSVAYWDVPPTPSITAPVNGQMFPPGTSVGVLASFQVSGCSIEGVEFYEGKRLLASFTSPPFSFVWGPPVGSHTITAVSTDSNGRIAVSEPVTFRVNAPPTVTLTSPANGAVFSAPANISLRASASDSDGSIAKVEFFANGVLVATDTSSPYSATWGSVSAGNYSITAKATDNNGAQTTSTAASITVQ